MAKLLTFKDVKTGKRFCFNPLTVASISEHYQTEGAILVYSLGDSAEEGGFVINYPYEDARKRWQEVLS